MQDVFVPLADMDAFDAFWTANAEAFAEIGVDRALALELAMNCSLQIGGGAAPLVRVGFVDDDSPADHIDLAAMTREQLAAWYVATVGYDPFADDPATTEADVRQTITEYLAARTAD